MMGSWTNAVLCKWSQETMCGTVDWIEYTPVPSYLHWDHWILLFSCILIPWLKLLLNLFYSCKIALKIFFPRGTEAVGRRQEYDFGPEISHISWWIWLISSDHLHFVIYLWIMCHVLLLQILELQACPDMATFRQKQGQIELKLSSNVHYTS